MDSQRQPLYRSASAIIKIPTISQSPDSSSFDYNEVSALVVIDGLNFKASYLQAGITMQIGHNGHEQLQLFYQWYPGKMVFADGFTINVGDTVIMTIEVGTAATNGTVDFQDITNGHKTLIDVSAPPGKSLVGENAGWIMSRSWSSQHDMINPAANLANATVTFMNCWVKDSSGRNYIPNQGKQIEMITGTEVVTHVSQDQNGNGLVISTNPPS